jgi:NTP pyrophosphatase (non-canonical NTP hydrolase)
VRPVAINRGRDVVSYYSQKHEGDSMVSISEALADLLADLIQAAQADGADFEEALRLGYLHAETEMSSDYSDEEPL